LRSRGIAQFKVQDAFGVFKAASRRSRRLRRVQDRFAAFEAFLVRLKKLRDAAKKLRDAAKNFGTLLGKKVTFYLPDCASTHSSSLNCIERLRPPRRRTDHVTIRQHMGSLPVCHFFQRRLACGQKNIPWRSFFALFAFLSEAGGEKKISFPSFEF
jgi:hypothetical protein